MSSDGSLRRPGRLVRLFAVVIDAVTLLFLLLAGAVVAFLWLLIRSSAGRYDAETGDTLIAASLIGAIVPAWTAWQGARLYHLGATFGQSRLRLAVEGAPRRRAARLLLHPLSLLLWGWLVLTLLLAGAPALWVLAAAAIAAAAYTGGWLGSLLVTATQAREQRRWRLPHDWLAKTRLVRYR